jgi:hypothetical protein
MLSAFLRFVYFPFVFSNNATPIFLRQSLILLTSDLGFELVAWSRSPRRTNANGEISRKNGCCLYSFRFLWDPHGLHNFPNHVTPLVCHMILRVPGGETWFPRAHRGPIPVNRWTACDDAGVKMGNTSVAILFYSLYSSGEAGFKMERFVFLLLWTVHEVSDLSLPFEICRVSRHIM